MKTKDFSARWGRFRPKMRGHTTGDGSLADGGIHGVSVGRRLEPAVGFDLRQLNEPYFIFYRSDSLAACQTEKPLVIKV